MQSSHEIQLEGGKKRRGPCKSRSRSMCGNKGCSWHKGVYRGSNKRKGSCNAKPRMHGGDTFDDINRPENFGTYVQTIGSKSGTRQGYMKGLTAKQRASYKTPKKSPRFTSVCNTKNVKYTVNKKTGKMKRSLSPVSKASCDTRAGCSWVGGKSKGKNKRRGYCKANARSSKSVDQTIAELFTGGESL